MTFAPYDEGSVHTPLLRRTQCCPASISDKAENLLKWLDGQFDRASRAFRNRPRWHAGRSARLPARFVIDPHPDPAPERGRQDEKAHLGPSQKGGPGDNPLVSRVKSIAILLVVAIGAFYLGSLSEFQWGSAAPDWAKTLLFYSPPKTNVDWRALDEVFTTITQQPSI